MLFLNGMKEKLIREGVKDLLIPVENQDVVHIWNTFVSESLPFMRNMRKLKVMIDYMGAKDYLGVAEVRCEQISDDL